MQQEYPKELSELIKQIENPSQAIMFTDMEWEENGRIDDPFYWRSNSFKPSSNTRTPQSEIYSDLNVKHVALQASQKVTNSLYVHHKKPAETCGWPNSPHGVIEITTSEGDGSTV